MKNKIELILLIIPLFLNPLNTSAQDSSIPADKKVQMENETLGGTYLPNAYNNKKTSRAYKYIYKSNNVLKMTTGSTIFTNQVNVDSSGQNIFGDAANEPNLTVNPLNPNEIAIGWRQFDNVSSNFRQAGWGYTTDAGQTWIFPGKIEQGIFRSDPVLDYDTAGNFYYNSLTIDSLSGAYLCKVFESADGGATWNNGTDAAGGDKQWMAIDRTTGLGSGNIYSAWTSGFSSCLPGFFTRSSTGGSSFEPCVAVDGDPYWVSMAVGNSGELVIGGGSQSGGLVVTKSLDAQVPGSIISWNSVLVFMDGNLIFAPSINPAGFLGMASIDIDKSSGPGSGNIYLLASLGRISNPDPADVMFSRSTDGGLTWSAPIRINDDISTSNFQWFGTVSVAPDGRIDVAWFDTVTIPVLMNQRYIIPILPIRVLHGLQMKKCRPLSIPTLAIQTRIKWEIISI